MPIPLSGDLVGTAAGDSLGTGGPEGSISKTAVGKGKMYL